MKLSKILTGINYEILGGNDDIIVDELAYDSRRVKENSLFIALVGFNSDGHDYINQAIDKGATAILCERDIQVSREITVVKVNNTRDIFSRVCSNYFDNPEKDLTLIGITGTKGKTTTSFMIKKVLECASLKVGVIGTTGTYYLDKYYSNANTTPESYELYKYMREMVDNDIKYLIMEVSSQALKVGRVKELNFDYAIFTNLTLDHVGKNEHETFLEYVYCKSLLFKQSRIGILNIDDEHYKDMIKDSSCLVYSYGLSNEANLRCDKIEYLHNNDFLGIKIDMKGLVNDSFLVNMPGKFSAYNAMAAISLGHLLNIKSDSIKEGLLEFRVRGRMERVDVSDKFSVFIDYAHNGVSMESILSTVKEYKPKRIVSLFGCGGNRSRDRRYDMGEISGKYADLSVITSDNSRYETFEDIAKDILVGMKKTSGEYIVIPDRREAIKYCIENGREGDVILILGKGHEDYQEINGIKYPFDERVVIKDILEELNEEI